MILFIINEAPYGSERLYNALRLAIALSGKSEKEIRIFLMADAVAAAKSGQKVPEGYYNVELMIGRVLRKGKVALCGTCMDARGLQESETIEGAYRSTMSELADWTLEAEKVIVF